MPSHGSTTHGLVTDDAAELHARTVPFLTVTPATTKSTESEMFAPYQLMRLARTGRVFAFSEFGEKTSQKVVFYLHGWPGSRVGGLLTDKHASDLGLRIIAVERPGYGYTPFWKYDFKSWAQSIQELADQLHVKKFTILGVSGGAAFAAACAAFIPEERVAALGLLCPLGHTNSSMKHNLVFWLARYCPKFSQFIWKKLQAAAARDNFALARALTSPTDMDVLTEHPEAAAILKLSNLDALRQGGCGWSWDARLLRCHWGFELKDINTKHVFCWHGMLDRNVPVSSAELYREIPNCSFNVVPDEGHLSISVRKMRAVLIQLRASVDAGAA